MFLFLAVEYKEAFALYDKKGTGAIPREQLGDSTIHSFATPLGDVRAKTPCLWDAERAANTRIFLPLSALMCFDAQGKRVAPPENLERLVRARVAA